MKGEKISWNYLKEICLVDMTLEASAERVSRGYSIGDHKKQFLAKK
ncbi:MAG: hypothetical protein HYY67_06325 [Thaumarchaeota archaeon]|nr:hypothetical protein [Nitrososphaerota archaeon]